MKKVEVVGEATRKTPLVRGKYTNLLRQGTNIAILDPDVVDHFPDSDSVNNALRVFLALGKHFAAVAAPKRKPPKRTAGTDQEFEFDPRTGRHDRVLVVK